jgi:hypothetical protein
LKNGRKIGKKERKGKKAQTLKVKKKKVGEKKKRRKKSSENCFFFVFHFFLDFGPF